ncbi:MAG: hypothetical protein ACFFKA_21225, partial [Candidatus Thorarchaeota archaeon]
KDLIDEAEEKEKTRAQLERTIENLELKIAKLESKLKEKQDLSKPAFEKAPKDESESGEINILKNLINSQNQELNQRNLEKEALQKKIVDLNTELVNLKENINDSIKDQVIMKTQNSLNTLIEDYGRLENMNQKLKERILEIETENKRFRDTAKSLDLESSKAEQLEFDLHRLEKQLKDIQEANKMLENSNINLKSKEFSVDRLEKEILNIESINSQLKKENQKLNAKLDALKVERLQLTEFETKTSNLEKEVQNLRKENEELRQKDAILLAKTINIMETRKKTPSTIQKSFEPKQDLSEVMPEKKQEYQEKSSKPDFILDTIDNKVVQYKTSQSTETSLEKEMRKEESLSRKKVCPNCGNNNNAFIREFDDKTKILYTYPRIYAKMYRCGQCGTEWR